MHSVTRIIFPVFAFKVTHRVILITRFCKLLTRVATPSGWGTCLKCLYYWHTGKSPEHLAKCLTTDSLDENSRSHLPQMKCFGHSRQTYGFTPAYRRMCFLRSPLGLNYFGQVRHVNQVPSLCDFSRRVLSELRHVFRSEYEHDASVERQTRTTTRSAAAVRT